jgi:hypothetical protein
LREDAGLAVLKTLGLYSSLGDDIVTVKNFVFCTQRAGTCWSCRQPVMRNA